MGSGAGAGKVSVPDLSFSKRVDRSSPKLLELYITGKHASDVTLACSKSTGGKSSEEFVTLKFGEAYVLNFQVGGSSAEDVGTESLSVNHAWIDYDYRERKPDGTLTSAGNIEYDLLKREQTA